MQSNRNDVHLSVPNIERDALFALSWFSGHDGKKTLLSMGNAEHEIESPSLEGEKKTIAEFINLEKQNEQITRMIVTENKTVGAVWIELLENHGVKSPSVHIIIGNPEYRRRGIGLSVMKSAIDYVLDELNQKTVYSRHLVDNQLIAIVIKTLGFVKDGESYVDDNGLNWQNIKFVVD